MLKKFFHSFHRSVIKSSIVSVVFAGALWGAWSYYQSLKSGQLSLASTTTRPTLVVSSDPGPNLPAVGRSLFDFLTMQESSDGKLQQVIPYPITKLESLIRSKIQITNTTGLHGVMFPLGRSLQRMASSPDFFRYPRVVMGLDAEPTPVSDNGIAMFLRNRLYVGFNEKAQALEVISYNELAGRFEFQVVHNYGPGSTPGIQYANRSVCIACHQNQAPIFSDAQWSETNAHPLISSKILTAMAKVPGFDGKTYAGFPIELSHGSSADDAILDTKEPAAIDHTKFLANLIPVTQFLWQKLCDEVDPTPAGSAQCRYQILDLTLKMSLSGQSSDFHPVFTEAGNQLFLQTLLQAWNRRWAGGLAIPNPVLIDRDPLDPAPKGNPFDPSSLSGAVKNSLSSILQTTNVITAEQEPLSPRAPLMVWSASSNVDSMIGDLGKWFSGLSNMFSTTDWSKLDQWIVRHATENDTVLVSSQCQVTNNGDHMEISACQGALGLLASVTALDDSTQMNSVISFIGVDQSLAAGGAASCALPTPAQIDQANFASTCAALRDVHASGLMTTQADTYSFDFTPTGFANVQSARLSNGDRVAHIHFQMKSKSNVADVQVKLVKDFKYLQQALTQGLSDANSGMFSRRPFSREKVMQTARGGLTGIQSAASDCCENISRMPPAQAEPETELASDNLQQLQTVFGKSAPFVVNCAVCHRNSLGFPPNFLYGSPAEVNSQLEDCAERISYRLNLWQLDPSKRLKQAMPPLSRLSALGMTEESWKNSPALAQLRETVQSLLSAKGMTVRDVLSTNYDSLPQCKGK
jgi:mono/diheme cytochrome c family protein